MSPKGIGSFVTDQLVGETPRKAQVSYGPEEIAIEKKYSTSRMTSKIRPSFFESLLSTEENKVSG